MGRLKAITGVAPDTIEIDLRRANLQGFDLDDAVLDGANLTDTQLQGARFYKAKLRETNLRGAHVQGAFVIYMDARGAHFNNAKMQSVDFFSADLRESYLNNAELQGSDLSSVKMQGAELYKANLQGVKFVRTEMDEKTSLIEADLRGAMLENFDASEITFYQENVCLIFYDERTSERGNDTLNNSCGSTLYSSNHHAANTYDDNVDGGFEPAWREWQKSIGFDPDTYRA